MEKFNKENKCRKCGTGNARSEYSSIQTEPYFRSEEVIRRTCIECGHVWSEEPLKLDNK